MDRTDKNKIPQSPKASIASKILTGPIAFIDLDKVKPEHRHRVFRYVWLCDYLSGAGYNEDGIIERVVDSWEDAVKICEVMDARIPETGEPVIVATKKKLTSPGQSRFITVATQLGDRLFAFACTYWKEEKIDTWTACGMLLAGTPSQTDAIKKRTRFCWLLYRGMETNTGDNN